MRSAKLSRTLALGLALAMTVPVAAPGAAAEQVDQSLAVPTATFDFEGSLQGWSITSADDDLHETSFEHRPAIGHQASAGIQLEYLPGPLRKPGYGRVADTALVSPWFASPDGPVFVTFRTWHDVEELYPAGAFDYLAVEWQRAADALWEPVGPEFHGKAGGPDDWRLREVVVPPSPEFRIRFRFVSDLEFEDSTDSGYAGLWLDDVRLDVRSSPELATVTSREHTVGRGVARKREGLGSVALVQTSGTVNPYHHEFRDRSPAAYVHPSLYLNDYPDDVPALWLSLDAETLEEALERDHEIWDAVQANTTYWIPGTRIVAVHALADVADQEGAVNFSCPRSCLSIGPHTTWAASRAVGTTTGMCPDCLLSVVDGKHARGHDLVASWDFIDVAVSVLATNEVLDSPVQYPGMGEAAARLAATRPLFTGTAQPHQNNGDVGPHAIAPGVTTVPGNVPGAIVVGSHDSGHVQTNGYPTELVADGCRSAVARHDSIDAVEFIAYSPHWSASPWAAGQAAAIAAEARRLLGDRDSGAVPELAEGSGGLAQGPLADDVFDVDDLREVLFRSASPRPIAEANDGPRCLPTDEGRYGDNAGSDLVWSETSSDFPAHTLVGYGGVDSTSLARATAALGGTLQLPARPEVEQWLAADAAARQPAQATP